jgi:hypothetical protein
MSSGLNPPMRGHATSPPAQVRDIRSDRWLRAEDIDARENAMRVRTVSIEFHIGRSLASNIVFSAARRIIR